jgi:hypothetical protein
MPGRRTSRSAGDDRGVPAADQRAECRPERPLQVSRLKNDGTNRPLQISRIHVSKHRSDRQAKARLAMIVSLAVEHAVGLWNGTALNGTPFTM